MTWPPPELDVGVDDGELRPDDDELLDDFGELELLLLDEPELAELEPEPLDVAALRRRFGERISDEELLLRFGMPGAEVDAMIAAGPAVTHYNPDLVPVLRLLRELGSRPAARELTVEKPGFRLSLKGRAS